MAITSGGRTVKASSASPAFITSRMTAMPPKVASETTEVTSPVCRKDDSASTSVVIRVMMRPAISRS